MENVLSVIVGHILTVENSSWNSVSILSWAADVGLPNPKRV